VGCEIKDTGAAAAIQASKGAWESSCQLHPRRKPFRWRDARGSDRDSPPGAGEGRPGAKGVRSSAWTSVTASGRFSTVAAVACLARPMEISCLLKRFLDKEGTGFERRQRGRRSGPAKRHQNGVNTHRRWLPLIKQNRGWLHVWGNPSRALWFPFTTSRSTSLSTWDAGGFTGRLFTRPPAARRFTS